MTRLLTSGILFLTAVSAEPVAKPLIPCILLSVSVILALRFVFLPSPLVPGFFCLHLLFSFLKSDLSVSYLVFKTNPLISTLYTVVTNLS